MGENKIAGMECQGLRCVKVKRRDQRPVQENALLIPGLPNEIATLCIARVPRASHLNLSGVSVSWRNLLHGGEFSKVRRELSVAEEWLYLWTEIGNAWRCFDPSLREWCKLPEMPHDGRVVGSSGIASIDGKIFVIGGFMSSNGASKSSYVPSKIVSSFDVRTYRWRKVADLNVARAECMTGILGNHMYVFGGLISRDERTAEAEVYDPITDRWRKISTAISPMIEGPTAVIGEKFHAKMWTRLSNFGWLDAKGVSYDPKTDKWEQVTNGLDDEWQRATGQFTITVLDGKLYSLGDTFLIDNFEDDHVPGANDSVHVYDPNRDDWEILETNHEADLPMKYMEDPELLTFCGQLCVISPRTCCYGPGDYYSTLIMVMLDVKENTRKPTCFTTFVDEFGLESEEVKRPTLTAKSCQIVTL